MTRTLTLTLTLTLTAACPGPRREATHTRAAAPTRTPSPPPPIHPAPHLAVINDLAVAPDGSAAVTVDAGGAVRFWPALDGSVEPIPLPVRGARPISLARRSGGHTVALVDGAGIGHVFAATTDRVEVRAQLAPLPPLAGLTVLDGGERILALGRDHVIRLLHDDGRELARLERRAFRPLRLCPAEKGGSVLAVSADSLQNVRVEPAALTIEGDEVPLPHLPAKRLSCAPDGRRIVYLHGAKPTPRSEPREWSVVVAGLDGATRRHEVPDGEATVGLVTDEHVLHVPPFGQPQIFSAAAKASFLRFGQEGSVTASAIVRGRWVGAVMTGLRVADVAPDGTIPEPSYGIGYGAFPTADAVALSPDGAILAWGSTGGELYVEEVGRSTPPQRLRPRARWGVTRAIFGEQPRRMTALGFVDDDRLVVASDDSTLDLIDVSTGDGVATIKITAEGGTSMPIRRVVIDDGLVYVDRMGGEAIVYEVDPLHGFQGPHVFAPEGGYFAGVGGKGSDRVVWRHDGTKYKACTLGELRSGACRDRELEAVEPARLPVGIDANGARWRLVSERGTTTLRRDGAAPASIDLAGRMVGWIADSPRGDLVVLHGDNAIVAHAVPSGEARWSVSSIFVPAFSADGTRVAVAAGGGVAVLDAATGAILHRRCAAVFGKLDTSSPTMPVAHTAETPSLCES